jgi:Flp pilus assembly pilin Flp
VALNNGDTLMIYMIALRLRAALKDKRGLETLEYAVFAAAFLGVIAAAVALLSGDLSSAYGSIGNYIKTSAAAI